MLKWFLRLCTWSDGGVLEPSPGKNASSEPWYRIEPAPYNGWALQRRVLVTGLIYRWETIAEYSSMAEAKADIEHLFGSKTIYLTQEKGAAEIEEIIRRESARGQND